MVELSTSELIGPKRNFAPIKSWLDSWGYGTPSVYPLVIVGDSGVGKSTVATAYAHEAGFDVLESHADADRDAEHFKRIFSEARMPTFFGEKRCLIIEDCEAISNSAWLAFDSAIKDKAFPLIIIAQSESAVAWRYRKSGLTHEIPTPNAQELMQLLNSRSPESQDEARKKWISENATSWRQAMLLLQTTPSDWDDDVDEMDRSKTGFAEIQRVLQGEHPIGHDISSHPLGIISAAEWNCADPQSVCEAIRLHSLAWVVDGVYLVWLITTNHCVFHNLGHVHVLTDSHHVHKHTS